MTHFLTLDETSIDASLPVSSREGYTLREAARAVVLDDAGAVALLHVTRDHYYKLPGGGIDEGETPLRALERELLEEIGCRVIVTEELGTVLEQRHYWNLTQLSHCYIARQVGERGEPDYTDHEKEAGFEIVWAKDINEAISLLESSAALQDTKEDYFSGPEGKNITFMRLRDVAIAKRAQESLTK